MRRGIRSIICLLILTLGSSASFAEENSIVNEPVQITLIHEEEAVQAGRPFWVAVQLKLKDKWHSYWKVPGGKDLATNINWNLPTGFTVSPILWPAPKEFNVNSMVGYGYEGEVLLMAQITPPEDISSLESIALGATVKWLACSDEQCVPGESEIGANLSSSNTVPRPHAQWAGLFEKARLNQHLDENEQLISMADLKSSFSTISSSQAGGGLSMGIGMALSLALLGGLILNLMPCVLPVISFKILSFVKMAGQSRSLTFKHGMAFSLGVLVSFWILAAFLLVLKAYGHSVGWGFQLQEPLFVALLAAVILVFGLSLFGVFEAGTFVTSLAGKAQGNQIAKEEMLAGSFLSGMLATAVATPCTGPFLGSAVGFATTVSAPAAMLIFTFLGIGMAFPYLLLSAYPNLMRFLPKPGDWMVTFKEIMGFVMVATVLWLVWVFSAQTNSLSVMLLLAGFFCLTIGCWVYGKWGCPTLSRMKRYFGVLLALACFAMGGAIIVNASKGQETTYEASHSDWEAFSPKRLAELRQQGTPVFIDFTAKWCLICQANHMVLSSKSVDAKLKEKGVVKMKADWTKRDAVITKELEKHGRNGVPLYLLYGRTAEPVILPQVLTPDIVMEELNKL